MKINFISKAIANSKAKKAVLKKAYDTVGYFRKPALQNAVHNFPNFVGPMAVADACILTSKLSQPVEFAQEAFIGALGFSAYIFRHVAIQGHKEAVKEAATLGSKLMEKGFSEAERKIVIKNKLSENMFFGTLFKMIYPKRVQKLADGVPTKIGFVKV